MFSSQVWRTALLICIFVATQGCGGGDATMADYVAKAKKSAQDAGASIKKTAQDTGASIKKTAQDAGATISKSAKETTDSIKKAASSTKEKINTAASQASQALNPTGHLNLQMGQARRIGSCYATFSTFQGRPSVLSLRTTKDASGESFPSAFLTARMDASDVAALSNQTVDASLFVAVVDGGDVWTTSQPIKVLISAVDDKTISGRISGGELRHIPTGKTILPQGDFIAVLESK